MRVVFSWLFLGLFLLSGLQALPQGASNTTAPVVIVLESGSTATLRTGVSFNVSNTSSGVTTRWAGVLGNVSGQIRLRDSGNSSVFGWAVDANNRPANASYPVLVASNGSSAPLWGSLSGFLNGSQLDARFGFDSADGDSATRVFNGTATRLGGLVIGTGNLSYVAASAAPSAYFQDGARVDEDADGYPTFALDDGSGDWIFATWVVPLSASRRAFDNQTQANFQLLLRANGTAAVSYSFYVELT